MWAAGSQKHTGSHSLHAALFDYLMENSKKRNAPSESKIETQTMKLQVKKRNMLDKHLNAGQMDLNQ